MVQPDQAVRQGFQPMPEIQQRSDPMASSMCLLAVPVALVAQDLQDLPDHRDPLGLRDLQGTREFQVHPAYKDLQGLLDFKGTRVDQGRKDLRV